MADRFVPYEKLSKKQQRKLDLMRRRDWGSVSPVTRRSCDDRKKYVRSPKHRNKADLLDN